MTSLDTKTLPVDTESAERLKAAGLEYRLLDNADDAAIAGFLRADARGFLDSEPTDEGLSEMRAGAAEARRNIGVYDAQAEPADWPVATVNSWLTPMTVPGGEIDMWAISSVTVANTYRRRGIARALLEGELRSAAAAGIAIAGLTASEATLYGRYGFAPAIPVARIEIDTRAAGWAAGDAPGRVDYVAKDALLDALSELHEQARRQRSGQIAGWDGRWRRAVGLSSQDKQAAAVRGVVHRDEDGVIRGALAYTLDEIPGGFRAELAVRHLTATTPEALRALWQFAVQHALVTKVTTDLRPVDDPITWLVADQRAVKVSTHDHGWLRILNVPGAIGARSASAAIDLVVAVTDSLGFAEGVWRLSGQNGSAMVAEGARGQESDVSLDVAALSSLYVGGVSASQLRAAGRIECSAGHAAILDAAFRSEQSPLLGIWY